ncbi:hypothetical protein H920_11482 [Fukomys damarensis]|uniref:Uncharacterized protein n=1 Tax=Fukomys damarensis TaxID=885580 RepID=A0A091D7M3_FUKDA|nr:hypothetical protein H920_11482 [Fukomys damarensis]
MQDQPFDEKEKGKKDGHWACSPARQVCSIMGSWVQLWDGDTGSHREVFREPLMEPGSLAGAGIAGADAQYEGDPTSSSSWVLPSADTGHLFSRPGKVSQKGPVSGQQKSPRHPLGFGEMRTQGEEQWANSQLSEHPALTNSHDHAPAPEKTDLKAHLAESKEIKREPPSPADSPPEFMQGMKNPEIMARDTQQSTVFLHTRTEANEERCPPSWQVIQCPVVVFLLFLISKAGGKRLYSAGVYAIGATLGSSLSDSLGKLLSPKITCPTWHNCISPKNTPSGNGVQMAVSEKEARGSMTGPLSGFGSAPWNPKAKLR